MTQGSTARVQAQTGDHASTAAFQVSSENVTLIAVASHTTDRTLDPILGVFTGGFAYYLYEKHPRTDMPEELRLMSLLRWKRERWQQERERKLLGTGEDNID